MNHIKFSIIIPSYNSEAYIKKAIESVLNQKYKNLELVIVNDGSTDSTLAIINDYAANDNRVKSVSKENGGYVSAVNAGLDNISGDYFLFMGSDDYLNTDLLLEIVNNINDVLPDMIVFKSVQVKDGKLLTEYFSNFDEKYYVSDSHFFENIKNDSNGLGLLCNRDTSKVFKTSLLNGQRYYGKTGADADDVFSMRFARRSSTFLFVPIIGYYWTLRSDSIMGKKPSERMIIDTIDVFCDYFKNMPKDSKLNYFEKQYLSYFYFRVIELARNPIFVFKHYLLIKNLYFSSRYWINRNCRSKFRYKIVYHFPLTYSFFSRIKAGLKKGKSNN